MKYVTIELHEDNKMMCIRVKHPEEGQKDIIRHCDDFYSGFCLDDIQEDYNDVYEYIEALQGIYIDDGYNVKYNSKVDEDAWQYDPWAI